MAQYKSSKLAKITIQTYAEKLNDGWHAYIGHFGQLGWQISYQSEVFAHIAKRRIRAPKEGKDSKITLRTTIRLALPKFSFAKRNPCLPRHLFVLYQKGATGLPGLS